MSPPAARSPVHRGAVLLALVLAVPAVLLLALAGQAGLGPGAAFPLLVLWLLVAVLGLRAGRRVAARLRAGKGAPPSP